MISLYHGLVQVSVGFGIIHHLSNTPGNRKYLPLLNPRKTGESVNVL